MRIIRNVILGGLLAASTSVPLLAQGDAFGPGAGMGSMSGMPGMGGMPSGPMKPQLVRRTVVETIMVPISPEELAEGQEYQAALAALRAEDLTPEQKTAAKEALAKLIEKQFARDLDTREKEVAELETRTKKLRQQLDKRKTAKAEIIALRLQTLQNEIDGLGFPSTEGNGAITAPGMGEFPGSAVVPRASFGGNAPAYDPPAELPATNPLRTLKDDYPGPGPATEEPLPETPPGANLLKNPSFEDGPNGWGTGATPETVEYTVSDKGGVNETQAARIHKTANKYFPIAEWTQRVEYDGQSPAIEFSAQVKTKDARKAILDVLFLDDKEEWIKHEWAAYIGDQSDDPQPLSHDFKAYKGTVAIPPNTKTIVIGLQDYGPGDVWFDDVRAIYRNELPKEPNNVPR
jgi:hypothetical protein